MKRVTLEQFPEDIAELFMLAQKDRVVITRNGVPYALIVGVENKTSNWSFRLPFGA